MHDEAIDNRIRDIEAIEFGADIGEIGSALSMVLTMYQIDDDPRIIGACKDKLEQGVRRLEELAATANSTAAAYRVD